MGVMASITADNSAGSGALTWNGTPDPGHSKATCCACKKVRLRPCCFISALSS